MMIKLVKRKANKMIDFKDKRKEMKQYKYTKG